MCSSAPLQSCITDDGRPQHPLQFFAVNKDIPDCIYGQNCGLSRKKTSHLAKCLHDSDYKTSSLRRPLDFPAMSTQRPHKNRRQRGRFSALMVVPSAAFHLAHPVSAPVNESGVCGDVSLACWKSFRVAVELSVTDTRCVAAREGFLS